MINQFNKMKNFINDLKKLKENISIDNDSDINKFIKILNDANYYVDSISDGSSYNKGGVIYKANISGC